MNVLSRSFVFPLFPMTIRQAQILEVEGAMQLEVARVKLMLSIIGRCVRNVGK